MVSKSPLIISFARRAHPQLRLTRNGPSNSRLKLGASSRTSASNRSTANLVETVIGLSRSRGHTPLLARHLPQTFMTYQLVPSTTGSPLGSSATCTYLGAQSFRDAALGRRPQEPVGPVSSNCWSYLQFIIHASRGGTPFQAWPPPRGYIVSGFAVCHFCHPSSAGCASPFPVTGAFS